MTLRILAIALVAALATVVPRAAAAADVVIGDLDDMSGVYADVMGAGGVEAIKMAIADFGGTVLGRKIVAADRRPPEQARYRRLEVPRVGRSERPQHAAGRLQHRRQHRHGKSRGGEEGAHVSSSARAARR